MSNIHDPNNQDCPLNDPETHCNQVVSGLACTCPPKAEDYGKFKYNKVIKGKADYGSGECVIDVYSVIIAFDVKHPGLQHALKKILMPGNRDKGSYKKDLEEAKVGIDRAIEDSNE